MEKSCIGHKCARIYEVRCPSVTLKGIFCPILRRQYLEMKRYGIPQTCSQFTAQDMALVVSIPIWPTGTKLVRMWKRRVSRIDVGVYHTKISPDTGYPRLKFEQNKGKWALFYCCLSDWWMLTDKISKCEACVIWRKPIAACKIQLQSLSRGWLNSNGLTMIQR